MQDIEFLKYEPTPNEKHLGVASIRYLGKIVLRYKIVMKKDGNGYFPTAASYKLDENTYVSAFMVDSRAEEEEIVAVVRSGIKPFMEDSVLKETSVFNEEIPF